jgi:hypothetical protein
MTVFSTTVVNYIQSGGVQLTADGLDAFLYDLNLFEKGNTRKTQLKGLLRGHILVRVCDFLILCGILMIPFA